MGGAGFVGSHPVRAYLDAGHEVLIENFPYVQDERLWYVKLFFRKDECEGAQLQISSPGSKAGS